MRGEANGVADWTRHAFMQGSNDTAEVRGSFQETVPRKSTKNTVKHRDGSVGSVVANHRSGRESSVVITTLPTRVQTLTTLGRFSRSSDN